MKKIAALTVLIAVGLSSAGAAAPADKAGLAKRQSTLNSEYALAKDSNFYFVLDVLGRKLELRVRGKIGRAHV